MTNNCKVKLKGNLGQDAKIINTDNQKSFAVISVATTDSYKDKNGEWKNKETLWHDVLIFSPNAIKFAKELKKGDSVNIEGTLSYKHIESKEGYTIPQAAIIASFIAKTPLPETETVTE